MLSKTSVNSILVLFFRAAKMAASLSKLFKSAPVKPGVLWAIRRRSTSLANGFFRAWTLRISSRSSILGMSKTMRRSKRPGRSKATSKISGRLVAATTMTLVLTSKPSISTKIWFKVCSRSSLEPPRPAPRWRPTASSSSTKTIQGALRLALRNKSRTREAPTPTNISTNSEPEMLKKGTFASPATARANKVLPVPGGPTSKTPLGIRAPKLINFRGFLKKSTTSVNSSLASLTPATSRKVILCWRSWGVTSRALLWPNIKARLLAPWTWRIIK